jgi:hypothetical protein
MAVTALIVVFGLIGVLLLISSVRRFRARRVMGGLMTGTLSLLMFAILAAGLLVSTNFLVFARLNAEQTAGELLLTQLGAHQFNATFTWPSGQRANFALRGDEWQMDARMIKWRPLANLAGFDAAYRLDRISGRYTRIEDERSQPRTVYPVTPTPQIDLWELLHRHQGWIPWVDARYGSAAYLPMADGASYELNVSQSGLIARPMNQAARGAVGQWR